MATQTKTTEKHRYFLNEGLSRSFSKAIHENRSRRAFTHSFGVYIVQRVELNDQESPVDQAEKRVSSVINRIGSTGRGKLNALALLGTLLLPAAATAEDLPIFDAHIHYSHDAVQLVPPQQVAKILRDAGVKKALVSSSDDDGTQRLLAAAPDIVVPSLRPYRRRGAINTWMHDPTVIDYLEDRLSRFEYQAIGEFHAFGDDIDTAVLQRLIELARERDLLLHHHGDRAAVEKIFETWPEARVLWAHSGFDPADEVADALRTHPRLWADFAFRSDITSRGALKEEWKATIQEFPDRFMVGTDTYTPERWYYVGPHADSSRSWLSELSDDVARQVAFENAEAMLATRKDPCGVTVDAKRMQSAAPSDSKVFVEADEIPLSKPFDLDIRVCPAVDGPLKIDATMPAHQHGMNYTPKIESLGQGHFNVTGMVFHMAGDWQIELLAGDDASERFTLDVTVR